METGLSNKRTLDLLIASNIMLIAYSLPKTNKAPKPDSPNLLEKMAEYDFKSFEENFNKNLSKPTYQSLSEASTLLQTIYKHKSSTEPAVLQNMADRFVNAVYNDISDLLPSNKDYNLQNLAKSNLQTDSKNNKYDLINQYAELIEQALVYAENTQNVETAQTALKLNQIKADSGLYNDNYNTYQNRDFQFNLIISAFNQSPDYSKKLQNQDTIKILNPLGTDAMLIPKEGYSIISNTPTSYTNNLVNPSALLPIKDPLTSPTYNAVENANPSSQQIGKNIMGPIDSIKKENNDNPLTKYF